MTETAPKVTASTQNSNPKDVVHSEIKFLTNTIDSGNLLTEDYIVKPPMDAISYQLHQGVYYYDLGVKNYILKFYLPNTFIGGSFTQKDIIYAIPSIRDLSLEAGSKDFTTTVPDGWKSAMINWMWRKKYGNISQTVEKFSLDIVFPILGTQSNASKNIIFTILAQISV